MSLNPDDFPAEVHQTILDLNKHTENTDLQYKMLDRVLDEFVDLRPENQINLAFAATAWAYVCLANETNSPEHETMFCLEAEDCFFATSLARQMSETEHRTNCARVSALINLVIGEVDRKTHDATLKILNESKKDVPRIGVKTALEFERFLRARFISHLNENHRLELINMSLGFCYKIKQADLGFVKMSDALLDGTMVLYHGTVVPMMAHVLNHIESGELKFDENGIVVRT